MPARPADGSTVAQTTTKPFDCSPAIQPEVQKIFSPFSTHSLVALSSTARVLMAEVSEPAPGSVIAIAPHFGSPSVKRLRKRSFCSGVPAASIAAPPNPELGIDR